MSGDDLLRLYVYALMTVVSAWSLVVGWLVSRAAWRRLRRDRPISAAVRSSEG